jgi:hypothetical protein
MTLISSRGSGPQWNHLTDGTSKPWMQIEYRGECGSGGGSLFLALTVTFIYPLFWGNPTPWFCNKYQRLVIRSVCYV